MCLLGVCTEISPPSEQQQELNDEIESLVSIANNTLASKTTIQHQSGTNCAPSVTHFLHSSTYVKCQAGVVLPAPRLPFQRLPHKQW